MSLLPVDKAVVFGLEVLYAFQLCRSHELP